MFSRRQRRRIGGVILKIPLCKKISTRNIKKSRNKMLLRSSFFLGATEKELNIEIFSQFHPFYTGKKKTVDTLGRIDHFKKMTEKAKKKRAETEKAKKEKEVRVPKNEKPVKRVTKKKK